MRYSVCVLLGCALLSLMVNGCGGSNTPMTYPVTGVVTFQGRPLPDAVVMFFAEGGRSATGATNAQGEFTLTTFVPGDGALSGLKKVALGELAVEAKEGDLFLPKPKPPRFSVRYTDPNQSGLEFEVKPGAENKFAIDLKE